MQPLGSAVFTAARYPRDRRVAPRRDEGRGIQSATIGNSSGALCRALGA